MKIKFLGTAAAEGVPAIGCKCRVCKLSRALGGRNMRSRSQALIDGEILIEFNPDTLWHSHAYGFDLSEIDHCLITHSHPDHLYLDDIDNFRRDFCHGRERAISFYAAQDGYEKIKEVSLRPWMGGAVEPRLVEAGKAFTVGGKYTVTPLPASHNSDTSPVFYSIGCGGKKILYAHDTGYFPEEAWELLKGEGRFDLVSLDCTGCLGLDGHAYVRHMTLSQCLDVIKRMESLGLVDGNTVKVVNHFSHNGGQTYDEMVAVADKHGVIVSYDGLEIEV